MSTEDGRQFPASRVPDDIMAFAVMVMGTPDAAQRWLEMPAIALDGKRPVDVAADPAGAGMVRDVLGRLLYGVYT